MRFLRCCKKLEEKVGNNPTGNILTAESSLYRGVNRQIVVRLRGRVEPQFEFFELVVLGTFYGCQKHLNDFDTSIKYVFILREFWLTG